MKTTDELRCAKCDSAQLTSNKKGFSGAKALGGAVLTGGIGLLAGTHGSSKIKITCLACGHSFKPGHDKDSQEARIAENKEKWAAMPKWQKNLMIVLVSLVFIMILVLIFGS